MMLSAENGSASMEAFFFMDFSSHFYKKLKVSLNKIIDSRIKNILQGFCFFVL